MREEVEFQLDVMRSMGMNTITFELRTCDSYWIPEFEPPECNIPPVLGLQWSQPTDIELANLITFFNLAQRKKIPNASFEEDSYFNNIPDSWTIRGQGEGKRRYLKKPEMPTRGNYVLRLKTGKNSTDAISLVILVWLAYSTANKQHP